MTDHHGDFGGLHRDLELMARQAVGRRRMLSLFGAAGGAAILAGCGGGSSSSGSSTGTSVATTGSTTTTGTTTGATTTTATTTTTTTTSSGTCGVADPQETNGPYPADSTNTSSGATSNVLTSSGVVRSDIRSSFVSSTTTAQGVRFDLTLTLNRLSDCSPLANYAIYLWHCDAAGNYSLYSGAVAESYLRGMQVTNSAGQVTFTTIFPGCYSGRYPHFHFEVFSSLAGATSGRAAVLTSQLAPAAAACSAVYSGSSLYSSSVSNFSRITIASDNVFGDNTAAQINQMTIATSGSVAAGYTGTNTININV